MKYIILVSALVMLLVGCVSGVKPMDSYTDSHGTTTVFMTDREACEQSCNSEYSRCMDVDSSQKDAVNGPQGMFGVSSDCHRLLKDCLPACKGR